MEDGSSCISLHKLILITDFLRYISMEPVIKDILQNVTVLFFSCNGPLTNAEYNNP